MKTKQKTIRFMAVLLVFAALLALPITAGTGSTVTGNTAYENIDCGIDASNYCLIDQNTAIGNGTNMQTAAGCVKGVDCAP